VREDRPAGRRPLGTQKSREKNVTSVDLQDRDWIDVETDLEDDSTVCSSMRIANKLVMTMRFEMNIS
jgi:hypothetical protein